MSSTKFITKTHVFPGQHIRQFAGATRYKEEDTQHLAAKQYIPIRIDHVPGIGITIIGAPAISFPKEMYEPLWDEMLAQWTHQEFYISSIWAVDPCNQGESGVLNEITQGDEPTWVDFARDLLQLINGFRNEFPLPIIGIGHSMGAVALLELSHLHPRLFASLCLFDPVIGDVHNLGPTLIHASSVRRDLWASREEAEKDFKSSKSVQKWDDRVLRRWLVHGLRETPTRLYPQPGGITLQTTKANESWSYGRNWFEPRPWPHSTPTLRMRAKYHDQQASMDRTHSFYRSEMDIVWSDLPHLNPGCLYILPDQGPMSRKSYTDAKINRTGTGSGGSGGKRENRVSHISVRDTGHLLPFEKPVECAGAVVGWLTRDLKIWIEMRELERTERDDKSEDGVSLSKKWVDEAKACFENGRAGLRAKL
ncbi:Hypothetical protein R9X50_00703000 [Acrodontium crateriforme]|uniref:AB hydrolase-1 domain-containing protein n=1 Tax=Acrodontium crateriforme TaxID=150365 RepID=A0AAQ3M9I9_9PEZI|nr:Hypothetical protein R9X50_00703000 [Acrodontium crateriforme]